MQSDQFQLHARIELLHWWFVGRRRIMRRLVRQLLPPSPLTTVVDIGCGTGANIAALSDSYRCVGIDPSQQAIEFARQRFTTVQFVVGCAPADLQGLVHEARLFLLMDVLEHVGDDFALLSQLLAQATPGSYFLVTVPADESLWSPHDEAFGHFRRYDRNRFERLWAGLPVTPRLVSSFNARLLPLIRIIRSRSQRRKQPPGHAGTDFWIPRFPLNHLLRATLAGESHRLCQALRAHPHRAYPAGASLIAILQRDAGPIIPRTKPPGLSPDHIPAQPAS